MATTNKAFIAKNGISTGDGYAMPDVRPSLLLDFANSKTLDPRITFTRGSTATYWDGKTTTKAEENLITYSAQLDQWTKTNTTVTAQDTTAPDGTTTADKLLANNSGTGTYRAYIARTVPAETYTASVYMKKGNMRYGWMAIGVNSGVKQFVIIDFDSSGVVVDSTAGLVSATSTSVGNGWYRVTATSDDHTSGGVYVYAYLSSSSSVSNDSLNGDGTQYTYYWGAQIEQRSSATAYTATTTSPIVKYQPVLQTAASGEARFDHDPVTGESKGLLIEEARTNRADRSIPNAGSGSWSTNLGTDQGAAVAPDGTVSAVRFRMFKTTQQLINIACGTATVGESLRWSFYAKADFSSSIFATSFGETGVTFDLSTGEPSSSTYGEMEYVGNGWYRCIYKITKTNTTRQMYIGFTASTIAADTTKSFLIWGAQCEVGAFPTSYIPTSGSTVTRSVDDVDITDLSSFIKGQEGTFYTEFETQRRSSTAYVWTIVDDNGVNGSWLGLRTDSAGDISNPIKYGGTGYEEGVFAYVISPDEYATYKNAVAFKLGDYANSVDGANVQTGTGITYLDAFTSWRIGNWNNNNYYNGYISKISYYPKRLSNATLQAMTEA